MVYLGKHIRKNVWEILSGKYCLLAPKTRRELLTEFSLLMMLSLLSPLCYSHFSRAIFETFSPDKEKKLYKICTKIMYRLIGKVICVLRLSCCHIIHHNFQFKALICFYLIARVKHASVPGEPSLVHYSFCAV